MELEHSFTVPVPKERAWDVLLDVERVAPCMPGATLDSVDGDEIKGRIKVKVGPISMTYVGTAKIVERDEQAGIVKLDASGKETRGAGTASASVRSVLEDQGPQTRVTVLTTLNVTGKPAQFGRGVMNEVSGKLLSIFATNLAAMLAQPDDPGSGTEPGTSAGTAADSGGSASTTGGGSASAGNDGSASAATAAAPTAHASDASLDDLKLPARAMASLNRDGITSASQLASKTEAELLAIDGIGPASLEDIKAKLAEQGLSLVPPTDGTASADGTALAPTASPDQTAETLAGLTAASPTGTSPTGTGAAGTGAAGTGATGTGATGTGATGTGATGTGATGTGATPNGAARSGSAASANGNGRTSSTTSATPNRAAPHTAAQTEADSINLIKVAGMPVLKRSLPVIAGVSVVLYIGLRRKMRRRNR